MHSRSHIQRAAGPARSRKTPGTGAVGPGETSSPCPNQIAPSLERVVSQLLLVAEATGSLPHFDGGRHAHLSDLQVQHAISESGAGEALTLQTPALSLLLGALLPAIRSDRELRSLLAEVRRIGSDGALAERLCGRLFQGGEGTRGPKGICEAGESVALTHREVAVLREATRAVTQEEIAERLGISSRTVGTHFENIYRKLGVNKPLQAVMRALELGYIGLETLRPSDGPGADGLASRLLRGVGESEPSPDAARSPMEEALAHDRPGAATHPGAREISRICADTGLLLLLFSAAIAVYEGAVNEPQPDRSHLLGRLLGTGDFLPFGGDFVHDARSIVTASQDSQSRGFTPGHIFAADVQPAPQGLNGCCIQEFTATGRFVRCFAGARELRTSLFGPSSLAFTHDGRLLATTAGLMEGIVAFTRGGRRAERFADGRFDYVACGRGGQVYAASALGLHLFSSGGQPAGETVEWLSPGRCTGLAASADGSVGALFRSGRGSRVELYRATGVPHRSFAAPEGASSLACDERGLWVTACPEKGTVHWMDHAGRIVRTQGLPAGILPLEAVVGDSQTLIVRGRAL